MSTTFGLFTIPVETDKHGNIISDYTEDDYVEIAHRFSGGITLLPPFHKIINLLDEDLPIYPLDNTAQGIYTIRDLIDYDN